MEPIFGTAHLFGVVDARSSRRLMQAAYECGFRRFDTAPAYGYGRSEPELGRLLTSLEPRPVVTTKVGILASRKPSGGMRAVKAAARRLPHSWQTYVRGAGTARARGHFQPREVRDSVEASLQRLGHIERLMLHEVRPEEIRDELLSCLAKYVERGDVTHLGVATANRLTAACVARAPELLKTVHLSASVFDRPPVMPPTVTARVGHGVLGPAASDLRQLATSRDRNADLSAAWRRATSGTTWDGPDGLTRALFARAASTGLTEVIVATSRQDNLPALHELASTRYLSEPGVSALLDRLSDLTDACERP